MESLKVEKQSRDLGKPPNWVDSVQGPCGYLSIRDERQQSGNVMVSNWQPSPEELAQLNAGGFVELGVCGTVHPPVYMVVREAVGVETGQAKD